jgi:hypothetical protein
VRLEGLGQLKSPITLSGIEPAFPITVQITYFISQHNHLQSIVEVLEGEVRRDRIRYENLEKLEFRIC